MQFEHFKGILRSQWIIYMRIETVAVRQRLWRGELGTFILLWKRITMDTPSLIEKSLIVLNQFNNNRNQLPRFLLPFMFRHCRDRELQDGGGINGCKGISIKLPHKTNQRRQTENDNATPAAIVRKLVWTVGFPWMGIIWSFTLPTIITTHFPRSRGH